MPTDSLNEAKAIYKKHRQLLKILEIRLKKVNVALKQIGLQENKFILKNKLTSK